MQFGRNPRHWQMENRAVVKSQRGTVFVFWSYSEKKFMKFFCNLADSREEQSLKYVLAIL
jgi:hypothetical protein